MLMHYGLRSHLLMDIPPAIAVDETKAQEWRTKDERVLGDLILSIAIPLRGIVRGVGTAKEAWEKVLAVYETKMAANVLHLKKELYQCRMEDTTAKDAMQLHISRMRNLIDRLASVGTAISAEDAGVQLYLSLPDSYGNISAALSLKPANELTFDLVAAVLLQEERRLQGQATASLSATAKAESALAATLSPSGNSSARDRAPRPRCQYCKKKGHTEGVCYQKVGYPVGHPLHGTDKDRHSNQGPHAHFAYSAMVIDASTPPGPSDPRTLAAAAFCSSEDASVAFSTVERLPPSTEWLIDSGASQHICGTAEWFATYQPVTGKAVAIANGHRIPAKGRGDINVDIEVNGRSKTGVFRDVLHAPGMAYNLLSVLRLTEAGLSVNFNGQDCIIRSKNGRVIGRATRKSGTTSMYAIHVRPHAGSACAAVAFDEDEDVPELIAADDGLSTNCQLTALSTTSTTQAEAEDIPSALEEDLVLCHDNYYAALADLRQEDSQHTPWQLAHLRMGHLHSKALAQLPSMATDAEWIAAGAQDAALPCEGCLLGKSHREVMPSVATHRATKVLELVHSDVCGPLSTASLTGLTYFVLFIDDFSRFTVALPIARKSDVFDCFLTFKAWAETLTGARIRTLRTDGGGEYGSKEFDRLLAATGTARQRTPPYTPQHNGVAERANRTLMDEVRALLTSANLSHSFWALALQAAVYLRNRSPTRIVVGMTPFEAFTGRRPSLGNLRVWGCLAYVHIPKQKRTGKLAPRSTPCIFVGYSQESKAYLLWDPSRKTVVTSRDVTFIEHLHGSDRHPSSPLAKQNRADNPEEGGNSETLSATAPESQSPHVPPARPTQAPLARPTQVIARSDIGLPSAQPSVVTRRRAAQLAAARSSGSNAVGEATPRSSPSSFSDFVRQQCADDDSIDPEDRIPLSQLLNQAPTGSQSSSDSHALYADSETSDTADGDPTTFKEAMRRDDRAQWKQAAQEEFGSIQAAGTWTLVPLPAGRKAIGCKWVFKLKRKADGSIDRYKARIVAKGYSQKEGVDYTETFAPVAKFSAIRALLSLCAFYDFELHQMDVTTAFLNGDLEQEIYMTQPEGFVDPTKPHYVCLLHHSLYGLKQAGRSWNEKIDTTLHGLGFSSLKSDSCVYIYGKARIVVYIALYVDDLLLASNSMQALTRLKADLAQKFAMKDLGEAQYMLGLQIERNRAARTLSISQGEYVRHVLDRFGMWDSKPVPTPLEISSKLTRADCPAAGTTPDTAFIRLYQSAVGAIMYAMLGTRPDIAFAVTALSQFNSNPGQAHWTAVKHVMRYLRGTVDYKLTYGSTGNAVVSPIVLGYSDSDWGSNADDRRSVTGYVFLLGGGAVSWQARKHCVISEKVHFSTVEVGPLCKSSVQMTLGGSQNPLSPV